MIVSAVAVIAGFVVTYLVGFEDDVIENMCSTFNMLNADSPQYFKDMTDGLVRRAVKLLKRLLGDEATLLDLNTIVWNVGDEGRKNYVMALRRKSTMPDGSPIRPDIKRENDELIDWFLNDYYAGIGGAKGAPKTYENTSGVRTQISKLVSNTYLKKVLNPPRKGEEGYEESLHIPHINFDTALAEGMVITMSTCQGKLRDLGRFLGYFIILQLQAAVFRRPGTEDTRTHNMLYIDEFQVYSNPGFADMLTQGRSYRVASHLATQARAQIGMGSGKDGKNFVELVSTNCRNKIIYPGVSFTDAKFYSDAFGQITYRIVSHNSVQAPGVSKISYIPADINKILDQMVLADNERRAINKNDLNECLNVDNRELTTPATTIPDPAQGEVTDYFDMENFDNITNESFDLEPTDEIQKPKRNIFEETTKNNNVSNNDEFFENGSLIPDKPMAKPPKKSVAQKKEVEYIDLDNL